MVWKKVGVLLIAGLLIFNVTGCGSSANASSSAAESTEESATDTTDEAEATGDADEADYAGEGDPEETDYAGEGDEDADAEDYSGEGDPEEEVFTSEMTAAPDDKTIAESFVGESIDELISEFGDPISSSKEPSCQNDGEDGIYTWDEFTVYTNSEEVGGEQIIQSVE